MKKKRDLAQVVRELNPEVIIKAAARCDGHTIFKPQAFLELGLPEDLVRHFTRKYRSDGSPKGTIFVQGQAVKDLEGVYGLELLEFLAGCLKLEYRQCMGRGFQSQSIQMALHQHFKAQS